MSGVVRTRRPILFLAYGDTGADWLTAAVARCRDDATLRRFVERGIIQFWCIGQGAANQPVRFFEVVPEPAVLAALLGESRSVQATAEFPELEVREVLVLERLAIFDPASEARSQLAAVLDRASLVNLDAEASDEEFSYRWVTLADAVRSAAPPDPTLGRVALAVLSARPAAVTFLVDRLDSATAQVDRAFADGALHRVAFAYAAGDLGAPRADGSSIVLPEPIARPQTASFVPFNVLELEHQQSVIDQGRVIALRNRLADGLSDLTRADSLFARGASLSKALRVDLEEVSRGALDPHHSRIRRAEGARDLIAWVLAEGQTNRARNVISDVRRDLPKIAAERHTAVRGAPALALAMQGPVPDSFDPVALAAGAVAIVGALAFLLYRRRPAPLDAVRSDVRTTADPPAAAELRAEWEKLCGALDGLLDEWDRAVASMNGDRSIRDAWESRPPFAWGLVEVPTAAPDEIPVTPELCQSVARTAVDEIDRGVPPGAAFDEALRRVLRRFGGGGGAAALPMTIDDSAATRIRAQIDRRPWLLKADCPIHVESVLWLTAPELELESTVQALEPHRTRNAASLLSHDWPERSTRIAIGTPVEFRQVQSLSFLFGEA